ncbi:MAG: peptidase glycoprotease [Frankiales bacterium]|nr:peptidase glycoprotease [Frankiales bacterium]
MVTLVIDTSAAAVIAGVVDQSGAVRVLAQEITVDARRHGELLSPSIAVALRRAGALRSEVAAVVVGTGPGPFTGLRVGLVTAAALADALAVPVYGVCSLDAIGGARQADGPILIVTDARRKEVYWAYYERGVRRLGPDVDRPEAVADRFMPDRPVVAGAGRHLYPDMFASFPQPDGDPRYPSVAGLAEAADERVRTGAPSETLVPLYLRRPDAVVPSARKSVVQ